MQLALFDLFDSAIARSAGSFIFCSTPGAHAPGFMLPLASRVVRRTLASVTAQEVRDGLSELLWNPIHRIVCLTFEHDESLLGQGIY